MYRPHRQAPDRFFDHVYDPLFTTSGQRDILRKNHHALAVSAPIDIYPIFHTMFTDLPWRPRNYYIPKRNALPRGDTLMANRATVTSNAVEPERPVVTVCGVDRAKHFGAPIVNRRTISLRLQLEHDCRCIPAPPTPIPPPRAVGCQSDYRVSSAQTKPWHPDALYVHPQTCAFDRPDTPELLRVDQLLKDEPHELPGLYHAEMVLRARKRRRFELSLPPLETVADWERRRTVMEAFDWEEWLAREGHIEYMQRLRLGLVQKLMAEREQRKRTKCEHQVDKTARRLEAEKKKKLEALRNDYRRKQRRLDVWHKGVELKWRPVDVITEHIDPASTLYLPVKRFGDHPKQRHFKLYPTRFRPSYETQQKTVEEIAATACKPSTSKTTDNEELQKLYNELVSLRSGHEVGTPNCLKTIESPPLYKFDTPKDDNAEALDDHKQQMAIYIQKIMKGRAVQKQLYNGRNKFRFLIAEFRSSHQLNDIVALNQLQWRTNYTTAVRKKAHRRRMQLHALMTAEDQLFEVIGQAVSTTISFALDLLESEMVRFVDQRMAHALCMMAETERYRREAAEAGRRQVSENRRRFHDECVRSVTMVRQNTVCHYLEDVLVECMDKMAERRARAHIRATVQQIDREANDPSAENIVQGILERDILPDVMRRIAHENYLADVHRSFFGDALPDKIDEQRKVKQMMNDALVAKQRERDAAATAAKAAAMFDGLGPMKDVAHQEAMDCIERVLAKVLRRTAEWDGVGKKPSGSICEEIAASVPPSALDEDADRLSVDGVSTRSSNQERLQEIVQEVNETVRKYAEEKPKEETTSAENIDAARARGVRVSFLGDDVVDLGDDDD